GTVSNLTVEGSVKGKDNVGGIAGYSTGTITNCTNKMIVTGSNNNIGGIAGYSTGTITNCTNGANVEGNAAVGGIVGKADGAGNVISGCSNTGAITSRGTLEDKKNGIGLGAYLGGIAGLTYGDINHCYNGNTVAVQSAYGNSDIVGGIVGQSTSTISYCANIGIVRGSNKVGGIAGYKTSDTSYCYNTGKIEKLYNGFAGGIIGEKAGGTVTNCWALYTGEKPPAEGGLDDNNKGSVVLNHLGIGYKPFLGGDAKNWTDIISTNIDGWGLDVFTVTKGSFLNISNTISKTDSTPTTYVSPTGIGTDILNNGVGGVQIKQMYFAATSQAAATNNIVLSLGNQSSGNVGTITPYTSLTYK
ncbi:MAG: GLUG motif-containing protein, partial [Clostridia bacterium]